MSTAAFYDDLAPFYHLIYPDWEASIRRQGEALDAIIRSAGGPHLNSVLDAACGIGTQSLALAALGYAVTASDVAPAAVDRLGREAEARGLAITAGVADMRHLHDHHGRTFDVVVACDNAVPHLLTDSEILQAFTQFYRCVTPGGLCLISVRDYAALPAEGIQVHPYGVRQEGDVRYLLFQVWDFEGACYRLTFYFVGDDGTTLHTRAFRTVYYAVPIATLTDLLRQAGFVDVRRLDAPFFQPVLTGRKPA